MRVGMTLAAQMTDEQLDEFEVLAKQNDDAAALQWLEANFPDYKKVVEEELNKLKEEIKRDAQALIDATNEQG
jgi:lipid II:glycine glycyltransferase (peptidoglycan interpeptide bridge formation enzyme)